MYERTYAKDNVWGPNIRVHPAARIHAILVRVPSAVVEIHIVETTTVGSLMS